MDESTQRIHTILTPRNARIALVVLAVISVIMVFALRNAKLDYDFEKFFPTNDPELERYNAFREKFGGDNDFLMIGIPREAGIYNVDLLSKVDSLTSALERLDNINKVTSPTRLTEPIITPIGVFQTPYLRFKSDSTLTADSARIAQDPRIHGTFFSEDGKALLMLIDAETGLSKLKSDALLKDVEHAIGSSGLQDVQLAGRIHGQFHYIRMMLEELILFLTSAIVLLAIFLWWGFRSLWGVLVPIGTVGLAILWQVGAMTLMGQPLSILTMLLPTILFVVGMSDVVHILEHYLDELRAGVPRREAVARTYEHVGLPTFLTALTAAVGFATLGAANIQPLQEFGWFTAIGVMLTFLIAFTLLPAILIFIGPGKLLPVSEKPSPWDKRLPRLFQWTIRNRKLILIGFSLIIVAGIHGMSKIRVNTFLLDAWPEEEKERLGVRFFDRQFGGVRPFELEITVKDTTKGIWDHRVLGEIEKVERKAIDLYGAKGVLSPVTVMRSLNKAFNGGQRDYYHIPDSSETTRMAGRAKMLSGAYLGSIISADGRTARLSGRMLDDGSAVNKERNVEFERFLEEEIDPKIVQFHLTGMAYLIDRSNETLSTQLLGGMGLAIVITSLIMLWFFRDPRMVLVALIPNLIPLLFVAGVIGYFHIDLKVSTAIIFSIAFGIAEDDTIHMLAKLRQQLRTGKSPIYALKRTYLTTGKAVTVTGLMLLSGFVTLMLSSFGSIYDMGLLVTLTLAFALVTELLLMPVLVIMIRPKAVIKKTDQNMESYKPLKSGESMK
ncbi:MAG: RND family transporter [Flavobacteriales bacterium]|nr:RND family transporter [Flavobacteriales bacterium]